MIERERQRERQREKQRERQREKQREREREREISNCLFSTHKPPLVESVAFTQQTNSLLSKVRFEQKKRNFNF